MESASLLVVNVSFIILLCDCYCVRRCNQYQMTEIADTDHLVPADKSAGNIAMLKIHPPIVRTLEF